MCKGHLRFVSKCLLILVREIYSADTSVFQRGKNSIADPETEDGGVTNGKRNNNQHRYAVFQTDRKINREYRALYASIIFPRIYTKLILFACASISILFLIFLR